MPARHVRRRKAVKAGADTNSKATGLDWLSRAQALDWVAMPNKADSGDFAAGDIRWFEDGILNLCYNCVDRHLDDRGDQVALIWEGDRPGAARSLTYRQLHAEVVSTANRLKALGVGRGDRVTIYLPMILEAPITMLACARIGAVHSVVFAGFSSEALRDRIESSGSRLVVTADEGRRGGRIVPLKAIVDAAIEGLDCQTMMFRNTNETVAIVAGRDHWADGIAGEGDCPCEPMGAEDELFILYTSGSTGKPKGLVHTTGGYALWTLLTFREVFGCREDEVFWCTADVGWITGHSYLIYGPLLNGTTSILFEGVPTYPGNDRCWDVVARHKVAVFYTAPTLIRSLMLHGEAPLTGHDLSSLRLLGTVGEPIAPDAWQWYHDVVGGGRCPVVDTWWQTETGGIMMTRLPDAGPAKPSSAGQPLLGLSMELMDASGSTVSGAGEGALCVAASWPGQARTIDGDHDRFVQTYFSTFPGRYFSGDGARRDIDGDYWITGRIDDVINVSGHRIGTAEIEAVLAQDATVQEAAVVGFSHPLKGQAILCYVVGTAANDETMEPRLKQRIRTQIGAIASPDVILCVPGLPKTRSGKIMRRILRKIGEGDYLSLGDVSTLVDPDLVPILVEQHRTAAAQRQG